MCGFIFRRNDAISWCVATLMTVALPAVTNGQQLPPIRPLSGALYSSTELFGAVSEVRLLPAGQLLVNDMIHHRLVILDSTLNLRSTVADSALSGGRRYPNRPAGIIPFRGDSTLFVDQSSLSVVVIDGAGRFTRVMGWPRPEDMHLLLGGTNGMPGLDQLGRLVYRGPSSYQNLLATSADSGRKFASRELDSVALLRVDLQTRELDTAAFLRFYKDEPATSDMGDGRTLTMSASDPLPSVDDWAVMPDGSVAIIRARDYHIDWVPPDSGRSTAKLPHQWQFLSDSAKAAIIDSARTTFMRLAGLASRLGVPNTAVGELPTGSTGSTDIIVHGRKTPNLKKPVAVSDSAERVRYLQFIPASELPDYAPPFIHGAVVVGADGNLWIRSTVSTTAGPVYDVVSSSGHLLRRVGVPTARVISAVGPDGAVFTSVREPDGVRLEVRRLVP